MGIEVYFVVGEAGEDHDSSPLVSKLRMNGALPLFLKMLSLCAQGQIYYENITLIPLEVHFGGTRSASDIFCHC